MEYPEYIVINRTTSDERFKQKFDSIFTMPKDFDPKDPKRVKIFGERLQILLKTVENRNDLIETKEYLDERGKKSDIAVSGPKYCDVKNAKMLAERLGVTEATISQYIHGKNKSVPQHFFMILFDIFGATPHYLTGYTNKMGVTLRLDGDRKIVKKDGVPIELFDPMTDIFSTQQYVHSQFTRLLFQSPEHFTTITDLLYADENVQNGGFSILRTYLDTHKKNK